MTDPAHLPHIFPGMRYADAPAAIAWLCRAFGFEQQFVVPGPEGTIAHAQLKRGNGVVMLGSSSSGALDMKTPKEAGAVTSAIYVYVDDVDAAYAQAKEAGAEMVRELDDTDYGSREFCCKDPEGFAWSFGTYLPGRDG